MDRFALDRIVPRSHRGSATPPLSATHEPRLEHYLLGRSIAHGMFQDFRGAIRRRFHIEIEGALEGSALVVDERFLFDDGGVDERRWRIEILPAGAYSATAGDMIGEARGVTRDGVLRWSYLFSLAIGERRWRVRFHDAFMAISEDALLNVAHVTKFGAPIGRTTIVFERAAP